MSNFALRLQPSLLNEARKVAETQGVLLNHLINVAVAEKLSALRTETYFQERAARADIPQAPDILKRIGAGWYARGAKGPKVPPARSVGGMAPQGGGAAPRERETLIPTVIRYDRWYKPPMQGDDLPAIQKQPEIEAECSYKDSYIGADVW